MARASGDSSNRYCAVGIVFVLFAVLAAEDRLLGGEKAIMSSGDVV